MDRPSGLTPVPSRRAIGFRGLPSRLVASLIATDDPERLADFYRSSLDLGSPSHQAGDHIGYVVGDHYLGFERSPGADAKGAVTLWFEVADLQRTTTLMVDAGATELSESFPTGDDEIGVTLRDLDGNLIGLLAKTS